MLRTDDRGSSAVSNCCITTSPADAANASRPSLIAAATSAIATVASNGRRPARQRRRGRELHDRYLLGHGDPSPCSGVLVDSRTLPARHGPGRGSPPHFNKRRDNLTTPTSVPLPGTRLWDWWFASWCGAFTVAMRRGRPQAVRERCPYALIRYAITADYWGTSESTGPAISTPSVWRHSCAHRTLRITDLPATRPSGC